MWAVGTAYWLTMCIEWVIVWLLVVTLYMDSILHLRHGPKALWYKCRNCITIGIPTEFHLVTALNVVNLLFRTQLNDIMNVYHFSDQILGIYILYCYISLLSLLYTVNTFSVISISTLFLLCIKYNMAHILKGWFKSPYTECPVATQSNLT